MTSVASLFTPLLLPSWLDPQHIIQAAGASALWVVALIVFAECGLAIFFMPGDSLLFAIGMFTAVGVTAGSGPLIQYGDRFTTVLVVNAVLLVAAVAGNVVGYWIGHKLGPALFRPRQGLAGRILNPAYVDKTDQFFAKHGSSTLILARFVPVVRTFVTMVAGIGRMDFRKFISYTAIGGVAWVLIAVQAGHFLGQVSFIRDNFELALILIVVISVIPMAVEWLRARRVQPVSSETGLTR
ncbi:MAG: VTT domain-containing protein [Acidipropionibacterium jensenii]|uniref:DedA family protein n=1 Tax=Acidipropionibacterium jensenii TaxID=1749 RepID=UPI002647576F|nr:VTT domain-containing protein [Acidipropionibacterium jensenii]MDN6441483.1 VTT domain-containing protein [Acidipropionibacterium jensenii]